MDKEGCRWQVIVMDGGKTWSSLWFQVFAHMPEWTISRRAREKHPHEPVQDLRPQAMFFLGYGIEIGLSAQVAVGPYFGFSSTFE